MTDHAAGAPAPELAPGDVYLYAFANGAVFVLDADGRSRLAPLDEAVAVAEGCHAAGCRVRVGRDPGPLPDQALHRLHERGIPVDPVDGARPPQVWEHGTTALIEAAAHGNDRLLDDLVARGATLHDRDDSGSTALHHAAANGNVHAIDVLVAAGLDPDLRNDQGFTPYRLATATRALLAAQRLADLGADASGGSAEAITFRGHRGALWAWLLVPVLQVVAAVIVGVTLHPLAGVAFAVVGLALFRWMAPPRQLWAGGTPRRLEGTTLTIEGLGGAREVDLRQVTIAAIGGATGRPARNGSRWLVLDHPDGAPVDRDGLRRLAIPGAELDGLAGRVGRVLVVPLAGGRHEEVLVAVGNVLSGLGVDLSATLRAQLARARSGSRA